MRKVYLAFLFLFTGMLLTVAGYAQISVTASAGTPGPTTYTTLKGAFDAINAGTHQGIINISVTASTTETVQASLNSSLTGAANYSSILIKPATGVTASISGSIAAVSGLIKLNGADNVTIDGSNITGGTSRDLTLSNTNNVANTVVVWISSASAANGATNNVIKNCIISGASATVSTASILAGDGASFGAAATAANSNNTIQNNLLTNNQQGTFINGVAGAPHDQNWVIKENTVSSIGVRGILIQGASNLEISDNEISGVSGPFGVNVTGVLAGGSLIGGNIFNNKISNINNTGLNFGCSGIQINTGGSANINIYNNFISDVFSSSGSTSVPQNNGYGIILSFGGSGFNVYNNTIVCGTSQAAGVGSGPIFISGAIATASAINLRNNILVNTQVGAVTNRTGIFCAAASSVFNTINNNVYFATSGSLGNIGGVSRNSIADMQTGFGQNVNSGNANPVFVSSTDLHLQNVLANTAMQIGAPIGTPAITTDIDGNPRGTSVTVAGAHELVIPISINYTPVFATCAGGDITLSGVTIADSLGVPTAGANVPRAYFRKGTGAWFSVPGTLTAGTGTSGTWEFVMPAATLGGTAASNTISYFVIAQNAVGKVTSSPSAGLVATGVNVVTTAPTSPTSFNVKALPTLISVNTTTPTVCEGTPFTLTSGSVSGIGGLISYNWSGPDAYTNTTTVNNVVITPATTAASGAYSLTVTYPGAGCTSVIRSVAVTVNGALPAITGTYSVCATATTTLGHPNTGGTWSSSNTGVATIASTTGLLTGILAGTSIITYKVGACITTAIVTVNPRPLSITGTLSICPATTTALASATAGGNWSSANASIATIDAGTGVATSIVTGTTLISYTIPTGCFITSVLTVNALPAVIGGASAVCVGSNTTFTSSPSGGTWSSNDAAIAAVSGTGVVTGVSDGVTTITYTSTLGCVRTKAITVNPLPSPTPSVGIVCTGTTVTMTNATPGGVWTSSNAVYATINATTGLLSPVNAGTANISYTLGTGCFTVVVVTTSASPSTIGGATSICEGANGTVTNFLAGGTWSTANAAIADVTTTTGIMSGVSAGTTTISYTLPSGCFRTITATVNITPVSIAGPDNVCIGNPTMYTNTTVGGTWTSSSAAIASINSATGLLNPVSSGNVNISYSLPTGCRAIKPVTVNGLPATITGTTSVCVSSSIVLNTFSVGGTWSSSDPSIASIDASGVVTGVSAGTASISYSLSTGCFRVVTVTVNPTPSAITGSLLACPGTSITLTNASAGGTWVSGTTSVATAGSATGIINGVAVGTSTISYRFSTGCNATAIVTVNALPSAITGTPISCVAGTTILSNPDAGGVWSSGNPIVATVDAASGVVSGLAIGTATIMYTNAATTCMRTMIVTVHPVPSAIAGTLVVCEESATSLTSTPGAGIWTSGDNTIATVASVSGVVTGVNSGTVNITYTLGGVGGCFNSTVVTVNPLPDPITGVPAVCIGLTTTLSNVTVGGSWSSANPAVATVDAGGIVTGMIAGTTTVSYTLPTGCARTVVVTVNALPGAITGSSSLCVGSNVTLGSTPLTGTWSSSDVTVATISPLRVVTGVTAGVANITYTLATGCYRTLTMTINPLPDTILGSLNVCTGSSVLLTNTVLGGTWSSSNVAVANIDAATGLVTGSINAGTSRITYTLSTGCRSTVVVTNNVLPNTISGVNVICLGTSTTFASTTSGGTWSSSDPSIATVTAATGFVSGIIAGTATISYTVSTGCSRTRDITVNPIPAVITGVMEVCAGGNTTLSNTSVGGTWASSLPSVATINNITGIVTGISAGTTVVTYKLSNSCFVTGVITVNALPATITGTPTVCLGSTTSLSSTTLGGTWSSSNISIATVDAGGTVTGNAAGICTIFYTGSVSGCVATRQITVNPVPAPITGVGVVCLGSNTSLNSLTSGGTWSTDNAFIATVNSTGSVTGVAGGNVLITYRLSTGCLATTLVTVDPLPSAITGISALCASGGTTTLANVTAGGVWSSSNPTIAAVDASGVVTGGSTGTAIISYTLLTTGCRSTRIVTVQPLPVAIGGTATVCEGLTTTLTSTPSFGVWSSSNGSIASVSASGVVTGIVSGTSIISYTFATGCSSSTIVTVNPLPTVTGITTSCIGGSSTLTGAAAGGLWTSSNSGIATVGAATGIVTGIASGVANITYTLSTGCRIVTPFTVSPSPAFIAGTAAICADANTVLSSSTPGGMWSSSDVSIATIGSGSGVAQGVAAGTATITYSLTATGCFTTRVLTVHPLPAAIVGFDALCAGATITLTNSSVGGTWSSSNGSVATINSSTGLLSGVAAGTSTITYRFATGCQTTKIITVTPLPASITGTPSVCVDGTTVFSTTTVGGTWSSSNAIVALVGTNGVVAGMSAGTSIISYQIGSGCFVTRLVTVLPRPSAIAGSLTICQGSTTNLSSLTPGGTWSSTEPLVATVGLTTGIATGISTGTATISYIAPTGCFVTNVVSVNPLPLPIEGNTNICLGATSVLTNLTSGTGTWATGNPVIATVDVATGAVTGVSIGTTTITYFLSTGCRATTVVTISPVPSTILGVASVCIGNTTTLSNTTTGGTWMSEDISIATINPSGIVTGISTGIVSMSYTLASGCSRTIAVTVNALPDAITGTASLCTGESTTLTNTTTGGVWTSSTPTVATVTVSGGVIFGVGAGTSLISYTTADGCRSFIVATVHPLPGIISGITNLCEGSSVILSNTVSGGTWTSGGFAASVNPATGEVTGIGVGIDTVRYTLTGGCSTYIIVTVNPAPPPITGDFEICLGETSALSNATAGGSWTSGTPSVATVGLGSGIVTSISAGITNVTYSLGAGCKVFVPVQINPAPTPITGPGQVCMGDSIVLSNGISGGTWSSSNVSVAPVNAITGVVYGVTNDTATITYQLLGGCSSKFTVTVNPIPPAITGLDSVCQGSTIDLDNSSVLPGIWTSSNPAVAPVSLVPGVVTGVSLGTAHISFTVLSTGCFTYKTVTVNPAPAPITGITNVCVASATVLSNATAGGTWISSNTSVATIGFASGLVSGIAAGSTTITYLLPTGCFVTTVLVVNPLPDPIAGPDNVCVGSTGTFTNTVGFGSWSSSTPSVASIGASTGIVSGLSDGTATITYTLFATGCFVTKQITVNPLPPTITGAEYMCLGSTSLVSNPIPGGTWSSSTPSVINVDAFGNVMAMSVGTSRITYTLGTACFTTRLLTVEPTLNAITGPSNVCEFATIALSNDYSGGIWTTADASIATVSASGIVTGVSSGVVNISYATPLAGCFTTTVITVDAVPSTISGADSVCIGATTFLTNTVSGGIWSSSDIAVATVDGLGNVTGVSANTVTISYVIGSGCSATMIVTVKPFADAGTITGIAEVCVGTDSLFTSSVAGGNWSSSDPAIATVSSTGIVAGVSIGSAVISYIVINDCSADTTTFNVLVIPEPDAGVISGVTGLCVGYTSTLTSTISGGTWSSSNPSVATISSTGVVTSISSGTAVISYAVTATCGTDYATVTVNVFTTAPQPFITVHPDSVVCLNSMYVNFGAFSDTTAGTTYIWTATNADIYATAANGRNILVNFSYPGTAVIRLTTQITSTGCFAVDSFIVSVSNDSVRTPEVKYYANELICTDNTADSYQWGYDDVNTLDSTIIYGANQQAYYLPVPDFTNRRYWVIAEFGGCLQKVYFNAPTNVATVNTGDIGVTLFPNPADSRINIQVTGLGMNDEVTVKLMDMLGKEIELSTLVNGKGSINVANLSSGVYSVMFVNNGVRIASRTFVKN